MSAVMWYADNPLYPVVYMTLRRKGFPDDTLTIHPATFKFTDSVIAANALEFTVPDPDYVLINHPMLQEDWKTEVVFRFGYEGTPFISEEQILLFYRQRPSFSEGGAVTTTIFAYDKGILFTVPMKPKNLRGQTGKNKFTVKQMLEYAVEEINDIWDERIELDIGETEDFDGLTYGTSKDNSSYMQFLYWARELASDPTTDMIPEIFVRNNTLFFRPKQKRANPVGVFTYHSPILGERLLSFEPEVADRPALKLVQWIDPVTGSPIDDRASNTTGGLKRITMVDAITGRERQMVQGNVAPKSMGDRSDLQVQPKKEIFKHTWQTGDSLVGVAEKYETTVQAILEANGLGDIDNHNIQPGRVLDIPRIDASGNVSTDEGKSLAAKHYINEEDASTKASGKVIGDPALEAGWPIIVHNVGVKWEGVWYLNEVTHDLGTGGYQCGFTCTREGVPITEGAEAINSSEVANAKAEAKDAQTPATQRKNKTLVNAVTGREGTQVNTATGTITEPKP